MSQSEGFFQTLMQASQQASPQSLLTLKTQSMLLERLEHFALYSDRLVFISGESGAGRSTLLKLFQQSIPDTILVAREDCAQQGWFANVLSGCGLQSKAGQQSFQFGLSQIKSDKEVVLLLDNADELSIDQIELLAEKVKSDNFHCVVSVNQNSNNLQWGYEYPKRVVLLKVEPITTDECHELLASTLNLPSTQLALLLPDDKLSGLIKKSNGNPGKLVSLATEILEQSRQTQSPKFTVRKHLALVGYGFLALLLLSVLIFQQEINQLIFSDESATSTLDPGSTFDGSKIAQDNEQDNINTQVDEQSEASSRHDDVFISAPSTNPNADSDSDNKVSNVDRSELEQFEQELQSEAESAQAELNKSLQQSDAKVTSTDKTVIQNSSESVAAEKNPTTQTSDFTVNRSAENNVEDDKRVKYFEPVSREQSGKNETNTNPDNISLNTKQEVKSEANEADSQQTDEVKDVTLVPGKTKRSFSAEETYLLSLDSGMWVIQLSGFSLLDNAADFMQQHFKAGELHFYRTKRNNSDWYVVIMGPFADKAEASRQRAQLPSSLAKTQPWLKPMSSVKQEIQAN